MSPFYAFIAVVDVLLSTCRC